MSEAAGETGVHGDRGAEEIGGRVRPFYCPYCSEEDFVPVGEREGEFHCRSCDRRFAIRFLGLGAPPPLAGH